MPKRLLLVRHAESTWNAENRWQGWADAPLSALGEEQATQAVEHLRDAGISGIAASDLNRARRTADILAEHLGLGPVVVERHLRELHVGDWSGLTRPEITARWPEQMAAWNQGILTSVPGGETRDQFRQRVVDAVVRLAGDDSLGETPVVVTHGGVIRVLERNAGVGAQRRGNLSGRWFSLNGDHRIEPGEEVVLVGEEARTVPSSY